MVCLGEGRRYPLSPTTYSISTLNFFDTPLLQNIDSLCLTRALNLILLQGGLAYANNETNISIFKHIVVGNGMGGAPSKRQKKNTLLPFPCSEMSSIPKLLSKLILSVWMLIRSDPVVEMHFLCSSNWFSPPRLNESEPVFKVQEGKGRGGACPRPSNSPVVVGRPPARAGLRPTWKLMLGIIKLAPEVSKLPIQLPMAWLCNTTSQLWKGLVIVGQGVIEEAIAAKQSMWKLIAVPEKVKVWWVA